MPMALDATAVWGKDLLVLSNAWLERCMTAQVGAPFYTTLFLNRETGRDYARLHCREFSFSANGQMVTAEAFALQGVDVRPGNPTEAIAYLSSEVFGLQVQAHYQVYADHPVLRKWLVIWNRGPEAVTVRDLDWEDLALLVDVPAHVQVWSDYLTRRDKSRIVTMDDCVLLVSDPVCGEGFIIANEAPGPLKRLEAYTQPARIAAGYNREDETLFERVLAPNDAFTTAASFLLPFAHPVPQDMIDGEYARFVGEHLTVCDPAAVPTVTVNTWQPFEFAIHRELLLDQIDRAAELGVEAYQVDAGWYDRMGDWNADQEKFPQGLEEIAQRVRTRGMRFGLWMAVATVDEASRVYAEHPEWVARDHRGEPNRHPIPGAVTMCLDSGYFDWIQRKLDAVVRRYKVDLLKLDLSSVRNLYAPGAYPGCFAEGHGHHSHDESHLNILERLFDLIRGIKRAHPNCLVDASYELYGVMDGTDLALTQVADQNWFTNITSPNEVSLRREIYQRGRVTRPWTLNFGGAALDHPSAPRYGLFSTLTSHALFWGDLARLEPATCEHYRRWFAWAKAERGRSDFYRSYQVSNVFPVPDGVSSRDYRHAIPTARYGIAPRGIHPPAFEPVSAHPGEFWDGVARLDARGEGPILLFRPAASRDATFQLRIPWVEPSAEYAIEDATRGEALGTWSGDRLIVFGIEVKIAEPENACVLVLRRA